MNDKKVIFIMGPTCSGKTDLAFNLFDHYNCELISVDSGQIYQGLDIGTATPNTELLRRYPHHLLNLLDPSERYSAAQFNNDASQLCDEIIGCGKTPILVGGTFLYFKALEEGLSPLPEANIEVRTQLDQEASLKGWAALHQKLLKIDPASAARIKPADSQRIQRALEVHMVSGRTMTDWFKEPKLNPMKHRVKKIALVPGDRAKLYDNINQRFNSMMAAGFLEEVAALYTRQDLHPNLPAIRTVGYRQLWAHLDEELTLEMAITEGKKASRHYAKRQLTWLKKEENTYCFDSLARGLCSNIMKIIEKEMSN